MGSEVSTEGVRTGTCLGSWTKTLGGSSSRSIFGAGGRDVRILAAATLELPAPNEMRTNG